MSANQVVSQTSQELITLASSARQLGDRMFFLQVERLKSEFEKSLHRYSHLQRVTIQSLKRFGKLHLIICLGSFFQNEIN